MNATTFADCVAPARSGNGSPPTLRAPALSWHSGAVSFLTRGTAVNKTELRKLQAFLRKSFGNEGIIVGLDPKDEDAAAVRLGERQIAQITVDDEDGDRSFAFAMKIPVGREVVQSYLQKLFENERLTLSARGRKGDFVELNSGEDFLGVISADDAKGSSYTLQIAILDIDLDEF
jgi:hypothetical protein